LIDQHSLCADVNTGQLFVVVRGPVQHKGWLVQSEPVSTIPWMQNGRFWLCVSVSSWILGRLLREERRRPRYNLCGCHL